MTVELVAGNNAAGIVGNNGIITIGIPEGTQGPEGPTGPGASDADVAGYVEDTAPSATRAALDLLYGGGSNVLGFYFPETHGALGYPNNDTAAIQAAIDEAYAAGGGTVVLSQLYGMGGGDITQKNGVNVWGPGITGPAASAAGLKAITGATTARYRWGNLTGHPYPGTIRDLNIDGDNIAGATTELFRAEAVETTAYDLHVMNAVACCVDLASSQNLQFVNPNFGSCTEGIALRIRGKQAGAQPPGHCVFFGGHLGDSKQTILVTSHDATFFVGPHDNYFIGTIIETGRSTYDIDNIIALEDGDTHFINCVFTIGAQVTAINEDCSVLITNDIRTTASTTAYFADCSIGGGAGTVKATDAVRVKGGATHVSNAVNYVGRLGLGNVQYMHCNDTADCLVTQDGPVVPATALTDQYRVINGGALAAVIRQTQVPTRYNARSDTGSPFQIRRNTDTVSNRLQIDRDGKLSWLDGAAGAIRGSLSRVLTGAIHFMTMAGTWIFSGGMGRTVTTQTLAASAAVAIDASLVSHQLLNFTVTGANATSLAISNGYTGAELRISLFGVAGGANTITWPGTGAAGIVPRTTLPQPIAGVMQVLDLMFVTDRWYEVGRSG